MYLPSYTMHGKSIEVPQLRGMPNTYAARTLERSGLRLVVHDSTFEPGAKPGVIYHQFPVAGERVKENRRIYVSIYSFKPTMVKMPNLIDVSLKQAEMMLKSHGLQLGEITYRYNVHEGSVLEQSIDGNTIAAGTPVEKGRIVDLVVSKGLGERSFELQDFTGMYYGEALRVLKNQGLELGSVLYVPNSDEPNGIIIRQKPEAGQTVREGETVDIWVAGAKPN